MKTLILGGVRSGKSRHAEKLARDRGGPVTVIATGTAQDAEMAARIEAHRRNRPAGWRVIEEPIRLAAALEAAALPRAMPATYDAAARATAAPDNPAPATFARDAAAPSALDPSARPAGTVIVDCLTLWLTNLLCGDDAELLRRETGHLFEILPRCAADCIFVSNEVGLGVMPMNALARRFGDEAGLLHQRLAVLCDRVVMMVAGMAVSVKDPGETGRRSSSEYR
jgi:adenosylcobinamide kinase / adenosylcobinamide-phosphate guanylyltransferase